MSVGEVLDIVPKPWRAPIVLVFLVSLIASGTIYAQTKASDYVDSKIAPLRKHVNLDHVLIQHVFEDLESDREARKLPRHTMKQIRKEAEENADDDPAHE